MYMVDLKTMGGAPDGIIASIGACQFDIETGDVSDTFHVRCDVTTQRGRVGKPETCLWWLQQSAEAQKELHGTTHINTALRNFRTWLKPNVPVWANGATFDHSILRHAYDQIGMDNPIHYHMQWCMRPFRGLPFVHESKPAHTGTHHNALDDAIYQAKWLANVCKANNIHWRSSWK